MGPNIFKESFSFFLLFLYFKIRRQTTKDSNSLERHYSINYSPLDNKLQHLIHEDVNKLRIN